MTDVIEEWAGGYSAVVFAGELAIAQVAARRREYPYGRTSLRAYAEITGLWVHDDHRRQGIAGRLVGSVRDWAWRYGYTHIAVEASAKPGAPGAPFYEAAGFTARSVIYDIEVDRG